MDSDCDCLQIRVAWVPELSACGVLNTDSFKPSVTTMFVTDLVLLLIMLVGLLRLRLHNFGLGRLLWNQVSDRRLARSHHLCVSHVKGSDLALPSYRCRRPSVGQSDRSPSALVIDYCLFCCRSFSS